jgi:hypothetical protein
MKRVCADCKKYLGEKEPLEDKSVTHGLCDECIEKVKKQFAALNERQPSALRADG